MVSNGAVNVADSTDPEDREPVAWLPWLLLALVVVIVVVWVVRRTSWYLAIDQFGYLTFARDLAAGRVSHDWPLVPVLEGFLPPRFRADVLGQTYVLYQGDLFCRYAPGFSLILAAVSFMIGPEATHYVNPVAIGVLLAALFWLARRALASDWLALASALLVLLLPTYVLLWSISPLRDVPAHTLALAGLAVLVPTPGARHTSGRWLAAGLLLGFAISTRIDAVLYGLPATGLALFWRPWSRRDVAGGAAAFLVGLLPLLAYNTIATGNPFLPTQAMELNGVLSSVDETAVDGVLDAVAQLAGPNDAYAQPGAEIGERIASRLLQGGGLRLAHVRTTLPKNLEVYHGVFGSLGLLLGGIGAVAALWRLPLFVLTVPYVIGATLFFSLWTRPDPRYLAGGILLFTFLVVHGAATVASATDRLRRRGVGAGACLTIAAVAVGAVGWWVGLPDTTEVSARPWVTMLLGGVLAVALIGGVFLKGGRVKWVFAVGLGLGLTAVVGWRTTTNFEGRGSFQREQVQVARDTLEAAVGERAVVFTTTDIGRPAENINFYTDVSAVYLREVLRWDVTPGFILDRVLKAGFEAYLLLPHDAARLWLESRYIYPFFEPEMTANIPAAEARRWFVASAVHQGVPLWLVRMRRRPEPLQLEPLPKRGS